MLSQVRSGALEFFSVSGVAGLSTLIPAGSMYGIGFAWPDYPTVWRAMDGELGALFRKQINGAGFFVMDRIWDSGFRQITTKSKPIVKPADLAGLKIRVPVSTLWTSMFSELGASPSCRARRAALPAAARPRRRPRRRGRAPGRGPAARPARARRPRICARPGTVDGAELACAPCSGQQISVAAARTGAGRLVAEPARRSRARAAGDTLPVLRPWSPRSIPRACPCRAPGAVALAACAAPLADGTFALDPGRTARRPGGSSRRCAAWGRGRRATSRMRALGDPDVFLAEDLGVRHALRRLGGPDDLRAARARAAAWAPWRSYASQHLWQAPAVPARGLGMIRA